MAQRTIKLPNGETVTIQVPDNATDEQIMRFVKREYEAGRIGQQGAPEPIQQSAQPSTGMLPESAGAAMRSLTATNPQAGLVGDIGTSAATGAAGLIKGLYDGVIAGFAGDEDYGKVIDNTMAKMGYQPQTTTGQNAMNLLGSIFEPVGEAAMFAPSNLYAGIKNLPNILTSDERADVLTETIEDRDAFAERPARTLGQDVANITGSPAAGASTEAGLNALAFVYGAKTPKVFGKLTQEGKSLSQQQKLKRLTDKMKEGTSEPSRMLMQIDKKTGEKKQIGPLSLLDEQEDLTPVQRQKLGQYVQESRAAKDALNAGIDDVDVSFFQGVQPVDKPRTNQMIKMARKMLNDRRYRENNSLLDVVGDGMRERYRFIKARNKSAGRKIPKVLKKEGNKQVDFTSSIDRFKNDLQELGLQINTDGKLSLQFTPDSIIEEGTDAANYLTGIVNRMATRGGNRLIDGHKLKVYIDEAGGLQDVGSGLTGKAKVAVSELRSRINKKMREASPEYAEVNQQYSDTIDVLNRFQKLAGKDVDLDAINSRERLGKVMRKAFSNYKSGDDVKDLTALTDRIAGKYGAEFKDSMNDQAMTAIRLRDLFQLEKSQTFQSLSNPTVGQTAVQGMVDPQGALLTKSAEGISGMFRKSERQQRLEALKAIEDIINEAK